jgi:hypothetical protein
MSFLVCVILKTFLSVSTIYGADALVRMWCQTLRIPFKVYVAHWKEYGLAAGPLRNSFMLSQETPDVLIAFPGGAGTDDCVRQAVERGIKVVRVQ